MDSPTETLPKTAVPRLRLHKPSGQFVADLDGRTVYLGKEEEAAWLAFLPELKAWRKANARKDQVTVREASEGLIDSLADQGEGAQSGLRSCLRHFHASYGSWQVADLSVDEVEEFKRECVGKFSPKTTKHYLTAAKRVLRYAAFKGWRPAVELSFIKSPPIPAPMPKHLPVAEIAKRIDMADKYNPERTLGQLGVWVRLQLALGARPSELVTVAKRDFVEIEPGVIALNRSKTAKVSKHPRTLILLPELRALLEKTTARYNDQYGYGQACERAFSAGPGAFRKCAAFLAHRVPGAQISREDTDFWLGHSIPTVSAVYNVMDYDRLKRVAESYLKYLQAVLPRQFPVG